MGAKDREAGNAARPARNPGTRLAALVFVVLGLATLVTWAYALVAEMPAAYFELSADEIAIAVRSWGIWGVAAIIGLMIVHSFIPFPAEFVALAAGMVYGPVLGTLYIWIGAMLGAWVAFGIARKLGRPFVGHWLKPAQMARIDGWTTRQGAGALLAGRLIPVIAFNLINYAAGLTNMSWLTFTWATGLGILPPTALMVILGDRMKDLRPWHWIALVAAAGAMWLVVRMIQRIRAGRARSPE